MAKEHYDLTIGMIIYIIGVSVFVLTAFFLLLMTITRINYYLQKKRLKERLYAQSRDPLVIGFFHPFA
jgi:hypothetical protein